MDTQIDIKYKETYEDQGGNYTPKDLDELSMYVSEQLAKPFDYNESVKVGTRCMMAMWNFIMSKQGHSGASASFVGLEFFGMTRRMKHGFMVLDAHDVLYPQHDLIKRATTFVYETTHSKHMIAEAKELLEDPDKAVMSVRLRWEEIAGNTPTPEDK